jgi:hypothetical protein
VVPIPEIRWLNEGQAAALEADDLERGVPRTVRSPYRRSAAYVHEIAAGRESRRSRRFRAAALRPQPEQDVEPP